MPIELQIIFKFHINTSHILPNALSTNKLTHKPNKKIKITLILIQALFGESGPLPTSVQVHALESEGLRIILRVHIIFKPHPMLLRFRNL